MAGRFPMAVSRYRGVSKLSLTAMNRGEMEAGKGYVTKGSIAPGKGRAIRLYGTVPNLAPPGATTPAMVHIEGEGHHEADSRDAHLRAAQGG